MLTQLTFTWQGFEWQGCLGSSNSSAVAGSGGGEVVGKIEDFSSTAVSCVIVV